MFQALFKRAERSIDKAVAKIAVRSLVAVPLLLAGGFVTAALTMKLVESYGAIIGYALMAALFGVIGLVALAIVGISSTSTPAEERIAAEPENAADTTKDVGDLLTPEVRALLASAMPVAVPGLLRGIGRNLPLIFILTVVIVVISEFAAPPDTEDGDETVPGDQNSTVDVAPPAASAAAA